MNFRIHNVCYGRWYLGRNDVQVDLSGRGDATTEGERGRQIEQHN